MYKNLPDLREKHVIGPRTRERRVSYLDCAALRHHGIELAGTSEVSGDFAFVRHNPPFRQVVVCTAGHGQVWIDDQWMQCSAGTAFITPARKFHAYHAIDNQLWSIGWVIYPEPADSHASDTLERHTELIQVDPQPLIVAIQGLCREFSGYADPQALALWSHLTHCYAQRIINPIAIDRRLERLWEEVASHLAYAWNIDELAQRADMSREHLRRLCQSQLKCSPLRHVTRMRMREAAAMLISPAISINEIAHHVGYENQFAFSVAFKREIGITPTEYRANARR
ncbi:AraC family transcriptional regulator [Dictyobacter kobayashii]|nr:AraC family transcriptional regulator [Dictyobacter kobayashii]